MMKENYYRRTTCRICGSNDLYLFLDLGKTALADSFISEEEIQNNTELIFPLNIAVCRSCNHIQLLDVVNPRLLFPEQYALFTSASPSVIKHFNEYAEEMSKRFGNMENKLFVEVASNDGALLIPIKKLGFRALGVEPATNTADVSREQGIEVVGDFFSEELAGALVKQYGYAGVISANNVLAHVDEPLDFVRGVKKLLDPKGVFVFEVQHGLELIRNTEFDNIYHEHLSFFTVRPLMVMLEKCGLKMYDIQLVGTQGGSIRCYATHTENDYYPTTEMPAKIAAEELKAGLSDMKTYDAFAKRAFEIRTALVDMLKEQKLQGKRIIGFGAPAKGNTLLNFCGIGPELVDYCIEKTAFKCGKFTPGMHIPVLHDEVIKKDGAPHFYLLLIWNYLYGVLEREKAHIQQGGKFIVPIPEVRVIGNEYFS